MGYIISMNDFQKFKKKMLQDPEIRAEYDRLGPKYALIEALIDARLKGSLTQKQLAEKLGTKQASIARLESGSYNPSLEFMQKVATGLGKTLVIKLK